MMQIETEFMSREHTLSFDNGKRLKLSRDESLEFEKWFEKKKAESNV